MIKSMKSILALLLVCALLCMTTAALAGTVQLGSANLYVNLSDSFYSDDLDQSEINDGAVLYLTDGNLDLMIYEDSADGYSVSDLASEYNAESEKIQAGDTTINGIPAAYIAYVDSGYYCIQYSFIVNDTLVDAVFSMESDSVFQQAANILNTLSGSGASTVQSSQNTASGSRIYLGSTSFTLSIPDDFESDELTSEDISDGVIAVYYSDSAALTIYDGSDLVGYSMAEILQSFAEEDNGSVLGIRTISGGQIGAYVAPYTEDGETYTLVVYLVTDGSDMVEIAYVGDSQSEADSIINTLR